MAANFVELIKTEIKVFSCWPNGSRVEEDEEKKGLFSILTTRFPLLVDMIRRRSDETLQFTRF